MRTFFEVFPCQERAVFLAGRLRKKLSQSLAYLLSYQSNLLQIPAVKIKELQDFITSSPKIPSLLYVLNSLLLEAAEHGQAERYRSDILRVMSLKPFNELRYHVFKDDPTSDSEDNFSLLLKKYMLFDLYEIADITAPDPIAAEKTQSLIQDALAMIEQVDPELYGEIMTFVSEFMIFDSRSLNIKAGSSFDIFGMIYLNARNSEHSVINMLDCLVHEAAHLYLYSLSIEDPLLNNDYQEVYYSPLRQTPRPLLGIFHGAFVLARVILFFEKLKKKASLLNPERIREIDTLITQHHSKITDSLKILNDHGKFTPLGRNIIDLVGKTLEVSPHPLLPGPKFCHRATE